MPLALRSRRRVPAGGRLPPGDASRVCVALTLGLLGAAGPAAAQMAPPDIALDESLNTGGPDVPYDVTADGHLQWNISEALGTPSGSNLFFSFLRFGVDEGDLALFAPSDTGVVFSRLIARVTGGMLSAIDGTIQSTFTGADFFLLNPSGIAFGPTSALDIRGSTFLSTADQLLFDENVGGAPFVFETGQPIAYEDLATSEPEAFGFLSDSLEAPEGITIDAILRGDEGLRFEDGAGLTIVGGPVEIRGDASTVQDTLETQGGTIAIASVQARDVTVPVRDVGSLDPGSLAPDALGPVTIGNGARLVASSTAGTGSGRVVIRAGRFELGGFPADPPVADPVGGEIAVANSADIPGPPLGVDVEAQSRIDVRDGSHIDVSASGSGVVGDVRLAAARVDLRGEDTKVSTTVTGEARGAEIALLGGAVRVLDGAEVNSTAARTASNAGGRILVRGESAVVEKASIASIQERGSSAEGGDIDVELAGPLDVREGLLRSYNESRGPRGGDIRVGLTGAAGSLSLEGGAIVSEAVLRGRGGDIDIAAEGGVALSRAGLVEGKIVTQASLDSTQPGGDLRIQASSIRVDSALDDSLLAPGQKVLPSQIATITRSTNANATGGSLTLITPEVRLANGGQVLALTGPDASGGGGAAQSGDIEIFGGLDPADGDARLPLRNFEATGRATLGKPDPDIPDDEVKATPAGVFADSEAGASGDAGSILVVAEEVSVTDGAGLSARAEGSTGTPGNLTLLVDRLSAVGAPDEQTQLLVSSGDGDSDRIGVDRGVLLIEADQVELLSGAIATANPGGTARGGKVVVRAREIDLAGERAELVARVPEGVTGNGGDVEVEVGEILRIRDGAKIEVDQPGANSDQGLPGNVLIEGAEGSSATLALTNGGSINASVVSPKGAIPDELGNITIRGIETISLSDAVIDARTTGKGRGGNIRIEDAQELALAQGSRITAATEDTETGAGDGGTLSLQSIASIRLSGDSQLTAESVGAGDGGNIEIGTSGPVEGLSLDSGSRITAATSDTGAGGTVSIATRGFVSLAGRSVISAQSTGTEDAGQVEVDAGGTLLVTEGSSIETRADNAAGGQIRLSAADEIYLEDSSVVTTVLDGTGGGGDIGIPVLLGADGGAAAAADPGGPPSPALFVMNSSVIEANADQGNGGNILISAGRLIISDDSRITATSLGGGIDGIIELDAPDSDLAGQVTPLSGEFFDASQMMLPACAARTSRAGSFVIQRRAAPAPPPDAPLSLALLSPGAEGQQCAL